MRRGYVRVSCADQHTEQQETALEKARCEKIFVDHGVSGTVKNRPALDQLIDQLRIGDVVVDTKIDRLGRDLHQMLSLIASINDVGADVVSLVKPEFDTTTAVGKLVFAVFSVVAQFERDRLAERTREGLARAKANGTCLGRPKRLDDKQIESIRSLREQGRSYSELADVFNDARTTARKYCEN